MGPDEPIVVAASEVPMVKLKRAGKDEFVWVNARHIVSFEEDAGSASAV